MIKNYYQLTKPGIIYGNAITAAAGFFLAAKGHFDLGIFLAALVGLSLVIASGCVFNNYFDREMDKKMARTKNRAMVKGIISPRNAITFGIILGLVGVAILYLFTNLLTAFIAVLGFFFYVVVYTLWGKPHSVYGTILGSISGAVPPVIGYTAVTNNFDVGAFLLFLILVVWQMPHFYAIAIYRLEDYKAAKVPVLPVVKGVYISKINIILYIATFIIATSALTLLGYAGYVYLGVILLLSLVWLGMGIKGFNSKNNSLWGKKMFRFSLIVLMGFSVLISVTHFLP